ncbi:MAG: hypothetical protein JST85_19940 [Acidobacteria bacterium]|nr:hypothetical protein [Acidobacteriota bacterium]
MNALAQSRNSREVVNEADGRFAAGHIYQTGNFRGMRCLGNLIDLAIQ